MPKNKMDMAAARQRLNALGEACESAKTSLANQKGRREAAIKVLGQESGVSGVENNRKAVASMCKELAALDNKIGAGYKALETEFEFEW